MKVYVEIDGGCSCYEVNVTGISTDRNSGGDEVDIKLSDLLGVSSETSIISMIDELITKQQNYAEASEDIVRRLDRKIIELQVELSHKAQEARIEASKDEKINNFREALRLADEHSIKLNKEIADLKQRLKDKERGYRFAGFKDRYHQLWTPVEGRNGFFEFRGEVYSAEFLKSHKDYLAIAYHEEVK